MPNDDPPWAGEDPKVWPPEAREKLSRMEAEERDLRDQLHQQHKAALKELGRVSLSQALHMAAEAGKADPWRWVKAKIRVGAVRAWGTVGNTHDRPLEPPWLDHLSVFTDDDGQPKPPIDDCLWFESGDGRPRRVSDIAIDTEALTALLAGAHKGPLDRAAATNSISCRAVYWPHGKDRLQVDEAVRLLQPAYPPAPIAKENDSELRSELIKVTREQDIRNAIISAGQDGLIQLVHPTLGISNGIVPEPDWFIGPEGFTRFAKTFGIAVVGVEGEQTGLPRSDTTKVNGTKDAAPNKRGPPGKKGPKRRHG
jgi:hypothetical protein